MELLPLIVFATSAILFVALVVFVKAEQRKGRRILFGRTRSKFDISLVKFNLWQKRQWEHFLRYILQLGWYYSVHSFLRTTMKLLVAVYDYIETHFERNRLRARDLRAEKRKKVDTHFSAVAEHKAEVALTPKQQSELKERKLEEKH